MRIAATTPPVAVHAKYTLPNVATPIAADNGTIVATSPLRFAANVDL
jgi:hypothetical protein